MAHQAGADERRVAIAQALFRDEMRRTVAWRARLDQTSNWAVILTASLLTWGFSQRDNPHFVILIAMIGVCFLLVLEASRYRRYDVWRSRIRLLERDILAPELDPDCEPLSEDPWRLLAADLHDPSYKIPFLEALQRRLRRVYAPLLGLLLLAWLLKVSTVAGGASFVRSTALDGVSGPLVSGGVAVFAAILVVLLSWPFGRRAMGELEEDENGSDWAASDKSGQGD